MSVIVELHYGTQGRRERKKKDRASTISYCITSVNVKDRMICIESC
jgi:hypothetical protein